MAFREIRKWNVPSVLKGGITCSYDPVIRAFSVVYTGIWVGGHDTTLTEFELLVPNNTIVAEFCNNYNKYVLRAITTYPFLSEEVTENAVECGYTVPPAPPAGGPAVDLTLNFIAYQVAFKNDEEQIVTANIFDMETFAEGRTVEYRSLQPSGEPIRLECIDNDEDKFTSIRAKQCIIEFLSNNKYDLNTFSQGEDNRWYVEALVGAQIVFKGYLILSPDLKEGFLSPPNIVSLTAIDGLGTLKDIPLTNFDGLSPILVRPKEQFRWLYYLGWALSKTSLRLPINIEHNLRFENEPDDPFFTKAFLDPKTFEDEIGTCISCYDVLERLLAKECFLTQRNGEWWVVRVDEIDNNDRFVWNVSADLVTVTLNQTTLDKSIKKDQAINWIERTPYVSLDRPHKSVKEKYNFDYPKEIIDNIDFSRGDQILLIVTESVYNIDDWTLGRYPGTVAASARIRRVFNDFNVETERYALITKSLTSGSGLGVHYIASSRIPMKEKDKFTFSVDKRLELNRAGSGFFRTAVAQVRLYADDGTYYVLAGTTHVGSTTNPPQWRNSNSTFSLNADYIWEEGQLSTDDRIWVNVSEDAPPIPKDGEIEILLLQTADLPTTSETHFSNLQFTYSPYINGTYQKFSGQSWGVSQSGEYKAARDEDVFVTDSPRRLFKGALQYFDSGEGRYKLTQGWYDYSKNQTPPTEMKPYGWFQAESVWNQYRRVMRILDGKLLGITETDLPDLIHRFTLNDPSPHTRLRYFMCLHFSMSLKTCTWTGYVAEVFKTDEPKVYDDPVVFRFIESR